MMTTTKPEIFQPEIKIKEISIENFRGFENIELEFQPDLTVLIGENGAGKTAVLDCLASYFCVVLIFLRCAFGLQPQFLIPNSQFSRFEHFYWFGRSSGKWLPTLPAILVQCKIKINELPTDIKILENKRVVFVIDRNPNK